MVRDFSIGAGASLNWRNGDVGNIAAQPSDGGRACDGCRASSGPCRLALRSAAFPSALGPWL